MTVLLKENRGPRIVIRINICYDKAMWTLSVFEDYMIKFYDKISCWKS